MNSGVYTITNIKNNKIYVGSTIVAFKRRKNHHFHHLRNNTHRNRFLQSAWNKDGEKCFIFEVLEEVIPEHCLQMELYWCNLLNTLNQEKGYNLVPPLTTNMGRIIPDNIRKKISLKLLGRKLSDETKKKIGKASTGRIKTKETRDKISKIHKGKIISKEIRQKISINSCKIKPWKFVKINQYDKNMKFIKTWNCIKSLFEQTGISRSAISNNLKNRSKTAGGFKFTYAT